MRQPGCAAKHQPRPECDQRRQQDHRNKYAAYPVGQPLHRGPRALRFAQQHDNPRQAPSLARFSTRIRRVPLVFTVPPVTRASGLFSTGIGSPVSMD